MFVCCLLWFFFKKGKFSLLETVKKLGIVFNSLHVFARVVMCTLLRPFQKFLLARRRGDGGDALRWQSTTCPLLVFDTTRFFWTESPISLIRGAAIVTRIWCSMPRASWTWIQYQSASLFPEQLWIVIRYRTNSKNRVIESRRKEKGHRRRRWCYCHGRGHWHARKRKSFQEKEDPAQIASLAIFHLIVRLKIYVFHYYIFFFARKISKK